MFDASRNDLGTMAEISRSRPQQDVVDLRKAVVLVRKHKWAIVLVTAIVTSLTAVVVSLMNPVYRSTVTVLFADTQSETGFERSAVELSGGGRIGSIVETQKEVLKSRSLAERVVKDLELLNHWEYNTSLAVPSEYLFNGPFGQLINQSPLEALWGDVPPVGDSVPREALVNQAVSKLMQSANVAALKNTDLVKVSIDSRDRALAPRIANGYAAALKAFYLEQSTRRDSDAKEFLQNKVAELKLKLDETEQQLLRERRRVGLSGDGGDNSGQTIALLNNRLVDAKAQLELARIQWDQIVTLRRSRSSGAGDDVIFSEAPLGGSLSAEQPATQYEYVGTAYEFLPIVDSNAVVQQHKQSVQEALRQLEELNNRYGVKHPRVVDAQSNLETVSKNLDRQIGNVITSVENQYRVSQRQVNSIQADINREESKQFDRNTGRVSIKEIELSRDSNKRFYEEALQEFRSYEERDLQTVPMSVSDFAVAPDTAAKPRKALIVLLAFILSGSGMVFLIYVIEGLKDSVQGISDIEKKLNLPVFGIIPTVKTKIFGGKSEPLIPGYFEDKRGAFAEAVWTIRTSATVAELEESNQVMIVTSTVPGEGKSTLATNLAYALSELENVVLLEADMRRPGVGKALGIRKDGLQEVLTGKIFLEESIKENAIGYLDILPAGRPSQSPGKLLASQEFAEVIAILKDRYDRVVIDLAPIQAVSDALVVGKYADSAIYVVKADSTPMPMVSRGITRLRDKGINVSGTVISQVDFARISSYGGDYYYQGYYDYYGYAETISKSVKTRPSSSVMSSLQTRSISSRKTVRHGDASIPSDQVGL